MIFEEFEAAINARLEPFGIERMVRPVALGQLGWKGPSGYAILSYHPSDKHYPAKLGFTTVGTQGMTITVMTAPTQQPLPFQLDDYNARSAAIEILRHFGVDFDADKLP